VVKIQKVGLFTEGGCRNFCLLDLDESIWKFQLSFGVTESFAPNPLNQVLAIPPGFFSLAVVTVQHQGQKALSFPGFSLYNVSTQRVHYLCPALPCLSHKPLPLMSRSVGLSRITVTENSLSLTWDLRLYSLMPIVTLQPLARGVPPGPFTQDKS
jgi:hypothetical protein